MPKTGSTYTHRQRSMCECMYVRVCAFVSINMWGVSVCITV